MSRRRRAKKRIVVPDPRYNSQIISRLINMVMRNGKKSLAQRITYEALVLVSEQLQKGDPAELLLGALDNIRPKLEVKSRRVGGATYQVPVEIPYERQQALAFRWLIDAAAAKSVPMSKALAEEIINAFNNTGNVVRKKEEMHKAAQANKAFAHLRF